MAAADTACSARRSRWQSLIIALIVRPRKQIAVEGFEQDDPLVGTAAGAGH